MLFNNGIKSALKAYSKDTAGQFAMMFAIASTVLIGGASVAVEITSQIKSKTRLQDVADATSLKVLRSDATTQAQVNRLVQDYLELHFPPDVSSNIEIIQASKSEDDAVVELRHTFPTLFGAVLGRDQLRVEAISKSSIDIRNLDIALVLDNTGSMRGRKLSALKRASNDLVDILYESPSVRQTTQIGLVPFASWVNVGRDNLDPSWIDVRGESSQNEIYFDQEISRPDLINAMNKEWDGCVENRLPPYDVDDTEPNSSRPETLFQPAFHPDMSDVDSNSFSYVADTSSGSHLARLRTSSKYNVVLNDSVDGPTERADRSCDERRALTPLTNDERAIRRGIQNMVAQGFTNIANGASWGFRVISPNAPFTQGRGYDDPRTTKAMVILTDGVQTMGGQGGSIFESGYSPFGFLGEPSLSGKERLEGETVKQALDNKLLEVCEAAKSKDVIVYTITFELDDEDTQDVMRRCATDVTKYFDAQNASQLTPVFREIAGSLRDLRISR